MAIQNGIGDIPDLGKTGPTYSEVVLELLRKMTNLDINFRPSIHTVIEDTETLMNSYKSSNKEAYDIC